MKSNDTKVGRVALVFGISGDQGQAVASGLIATGNYRRVYGVTRDVSKAHADAISGHMSVPVMMEEEVPEDDAAGNSFDGHVTLINADLKSATSIRQAFVHTRATDIFLVTATDVPTGAMGSFHESEELEYESVKTFFDVLVEVHQKDWSSDEKLERRVVFSTLDNVRGLVEWLEVHKFTMDVDDLANMKPLDDGGIVPHYSGKGRGGEYALKLIHGVSDPWKHSPTKESRTSPWVQSESPTPTAIPGLTATNITLPFLHTNFALSGVPLPTNSEGRTTQWSIAACLGSRPLDMLSVSDLKYIVPTLFDQFEKYQGRTIKLSGEKITMDEVAYQFSDLFGKDVIYSPLTLEEMSLLDIPEAPAFAQMCQYLSSPYADHDLEETKLIMSACGREPQTFQDWLLSHSDEEAFEKVGLTLDATPIQCVAVFNAMSLQGESVIKGLLADTRKQYIIRACVCMDDEQNESTDQQELEKKTAHLSALASDRVTVCYANLDDIQSCITALGDAEGVFICADFNHPHLQNMPHDPEREEQEERQARVVIEACAASGTVRHLVLSTMELANDVDKELKSNASDSTLLLDVKVRMAAYAKSRHISVTYVLIPVFSEHFFQALAEKISTEEDNLHHDSTKCNEKKEAKADKAIGEKVVCMSVESLGPAVANIFDSYEVYAGREIGLVTDILSVEEAKEIVQQVFFESQSKKCDRIDENSADTAISHSDYRVDIVTRDLGQMFRFYSKMDAVKQRDSIAKTMKLVPDAKPFKSWLEQNRDNAEFREMLGIR